VGGLVGEGPAMGRGGGWEVMGGGDLDVRE
jgi:hypothetical protein